MFPFYGLTAVEAVVNPLPGGLSSDSVLFSGTATAGWQFGANGQVTDLAPSGPDHLWFDPLTAGIGAQYWIRAVLSSGTTPTGSALNTWLQLSTARSWQLTRSIQGTSACSLGIAIATDSAGTNIVTAGTYDISASFEN